jgi:ribokinase
MKPRVAVVGSSNTDMIIKLKRIPRPGETLLGGHFMTAAGGKGANQAVAAARTGGQVSFIARVGSDTLGDQAIGRLRADGVDIAHVARDRQMPSGAALIFVSERGENSIAVAGGANGRLSAADVKKARTIIASAHILLMQLESPLAAVMAGMKLASEAHIPVILNPAPAQRLPNELLRQVSILTPNEAEAELLTGFKLTTIASVERAATRLRHCGIPTVIVTLGKRGALIASEGGVRLVQGFKVKAVDTTGAGDVFNGALAVALAEGQPVERAVRFANAAAAISVTREGAQTSAPSRRAIELFLKAF